MYGCARTRRTRWAATAAVLLLTGGLLTACSSDDGNDATKTTTGPSTSADSTSSKVDLAPWYKGTNEEPPKKGPVPVKGKDVWLVSCGQFSASCAAMTKGAEEAGAELGWTTNMCDSKLQFELSAQCVRQALAADADAIVLLGGECKSIKQALVEAKVAKVPVASANGADCDDPVLGDSTAPLFAVPVTGSSQTPDTFDLFHTIGVVQAEWLIDQTDGQAKVLSIYPGQGQASAAYLGLKERLAECSGCELVDTLMIQGPDTPQVRQKAESSLLQHPEINAVAVPFDAYFVLGLQQGLTASGRDLKVIGGQGDPPNMDFIRAGGSGQAAAVATDMPWWGWASMDALVRHFAGEKLVAEGVGFQLVDREHNLPKSGPYVGPIDFRPAYEKLWAGGA